ncbi:uncharacterized protein PAC_02370 [Phialocephala subalpina]|uniref:Heterokaryon incompatibility domain-containing protein n=1 Tax=Phialocephala subalpina TaxID=576137 RepID=A0A1L7WI86_9HELO|nr:uncharacterized protein PAC_02370 [Phialocephala subalpina]
MPKLLSNTGNFRVSISGKRSKTSPGNSAIIFSRVGWPVENRHSSGHQRLPLSVMYNPFQDSRSAWILGKKETPLSLSVVCLADDLYTLAAPLKGVTVHLSPTWAPVSYIKYYSAAGIPTAFANDCLRHCSKAHAAVCANLPDTSLALGSTPITLIDLESECLVFASYQRMYVALNYVWGSSDISSKYSTLECSRTNLSEMLREGFFNFDESKFPPTILDAMRFTKFTGVRYLWIDRYCIVQDYEEDKHGQLRAMGSIYYHAHFTIIAAEGDVTHGLRGFKDKSRNWKLRTCPRFCAPIDTFVGITYEPVTETTLWSTRGWTFQEQIFARKAFIFRGETIVFKCWRSMWQEGTAVPVAYDNGAYASGKTKLTIHKWPNMLYFKGLLEEFALRELTYPCDSLDALAGVLGALEASFPEGFLFGLPEVCFDIALLWQSRGILEDRVSLAQTEGKPTRDLPSWSWARWKGPLDFTALEAAAECLFLSYYNQNFCSIKKVVEWQKHPRSSGTAVPIADYYSNSRNLALDSSLPPPAGWKRAPVRRDISKGSILNHHLGSLNHEFTHESLGSDTRFRFPIPVLAGTTITRDNQSWSPYITGRVKSTFLSVMSNENTKENDDSWLAVMDKTAFGDGDSQVGVVRIHDQRLWNVSDGNFLGEFIAISAGEFLAVPGNSVGIPWASFHKWEMTKRSDDGNIYRFYNVMLIERRNNIAERRGLGRVEKSLWEQMALEELEITLG